jgi:aminoglycoside 6'-N-acetyltransferase
MICTERLLLRRFRLADVASLQAYRSDPVVARYQSWSAPVSFAAARDLVTEFAAGDPEAPGWFQYAIERRSDGVHIGGPG